MKVFGVLKQVADFDVRVYMLDLLEFNSGFYFRGMQQFGNMLCSVCEEQDPKTGNRIVYFKKYSSLFGVCSLE